MSHVLYTKLSCARWRVYFPPADEDEFCRRSLQISNSSVETNCSLKTVLPKHVVDEDKLQRHQLDCRKTFVCLADSLTGGEGIAMVKVSNGRTQQLPGCDLLHWEAWWES